MWTVVYIAPSQPIAELLQRRLHQQGLMVKVREGGGGRGPSRKRPHFEVLVPESEAEDAHELVNETLRSR